jgi:hypothetical protein
MFSGGYVAIAVANGKITANAFDPMAPEARPIFNPIGAMGLDGFGAGKKTANPLATGKEGSMISKGNGYAREAKMKLFLASAFMLGVVMHAPASAWIRMSTGRGYAPETMNPAYAMVNLLPPGFKPQVTGMDTLSDGTLVLSTREDDNNNTQPPTSGKIQLVKGLRAYSPSAINYRVIAEGLFEIPFIRSRSKS